jgi:DNA transformation protein and related proteins
MPREPFRSSDPSVQHFIDLMDRFGGVNSRAMFGGHGLYRDGVMFALLANGQLYLKVDEQTRANFTSRNLQPFSFTAKGRTVQLSYHEAPAQALEDAAEMADWCALAWQAALRAQSKAKAKAAGKSARRFGKAEALPGQAASCDSALGASAPLETLPNLGPRSAASLAAAGITSLAGLQALGAVRAFVRARALNPGVSLNLLWALEGALTGRHWQEVAEADRASLLMALEDVQREG